MVRPALVTLQRWGLPRRPAATIVCVSLVAAVLVGTAPRAAAAKAPPWRWVEVKRSLSVPGNSNASADLPCPSGYTPVTGGFSGPSLYRMLEYPNPGNNSYTFTIGNSHPQTWNASLRVWCAHADDVGPIWSSTTNFPENASGRAGGVVTCPGGYGVLSGGADWFTTGGRRIDFSGPTPLGDGWFAVGQSDAVNDTLAVEIRCVPNAVLAGEQVAMATSAAGTSGQNAYETATCPSGMRVMTGGSWARPSDSNTFDTVLRGYNGVSFPEVTTWTGSSGLFNNSRFTAIALCIAVSTPSVELTQVPPQLSTSSSGQFTLSASDTAGETLAVTCVIDDYYSVPCQSGTPTSYGPLPDGLHTLKVTVKNTSQQTASTSYQWRIDANAPEVVSKFPTPSSTIGEEQYFFVHFSEDVEGVDEDSFQVFSSGKRLSGTVTSTANTARWIPDKPLIAGQRYTAKLTSAIHDKADHALEPYSWRVRLQTTLQNDSFLFKEFWDLDQHKKASNGRYISSRTPDSAATTKIPVAAGEDISVWGLRSPDGGDAAVYLNGVKQGEVSFYAPSLKRERVFRLADLTAGTYTLQVRPLGTKPPESKGTWIRVDNVTGGMTTYQESKMRQSFSRVAEPSASGGTFDYVLHARRGDNGGKPTYSLTFRGTAIALYGVKGPSGGKALVYLDGQLKEEVDLSAVVPQYDVTIFDASLKDGVHRLKVVPKGTKTGKNSDVSVDRIEIG